MVGGRDMPARSPANRCQGKRVTASGDNSDLSEPVDDSLFARVTRCRAGYVPVLAGMLVPPDVLDDVLAAPVLAAPADEDVLEPDVLDFDPLEELPLRESVR